MDELVRKLGIVPGRSLWLIDAPMSSAALLRDACPPDITMIESDDATDAAQRFDLIFLWPRRVDGLTERLSALQWRIVPDGAIWVMLLKKPIARKRGITFTWEEVQAAALQTDLVDNKIASFSEEEYGARFVIRRDRRHTYAPPANDSR